MTSATLRCFAVAMAAWQVSLGSAHLTQNTNVSEHDSCQTCTEVMTEVVNLLSTQTCPEIVPNAATICEPFGEYADACEIAIKVGCPIAAKLAGLVKPEEVCKMIKMCGSGVSYPHVTENTIMHVEDSCQTCTEVTTEVLDLLSTKTCPEIVPNAATICEPFGEYAAECEIAIKVGCPIVAKLAGMVKPEEVCKIIRMCGSGVSYPHLTENTIMHVEDNCETCTEVMTEVLDLLSTKTCPEIVPNAATICEPFGEYADACEIAIKVGCPIAAKLAGLVKPEEVCKIIRMCRSGVSLSHLHLTRSTVVRVEDSCQTCTEVTTEVLDLLSTKTCPEIVPNAGTICEPFGEYAAECEIAIKVGCPIAAKLAGMVKPEEVCKIIRMCDSGVSYLV